jgi:CRISPR-associated protein Cmr4
LGKIGGINMNDFRIGYLYSLSPIHCGGEGDLGNILEIVREVHTNFPYIPGSSLRGSLRDEVKEYAGELTSDRLFGRELSNGNQMGVHQVWFGDARLLWVPMRTMSSQGQDIFMWVSCHSLLRDHALVAKQKGVLFPNHSVGDRPGNYNIADAALRVEALDTQAKTSLALAGQWHTDLKDITAQTWQSSRIILPDNDFQVLMEHSLWTQIRNKIHEDSGSAEIFWTDVCIPRDTILYYPWGYTLNKADPVQTGDHDALKTILTGLIQVGGQANVGRGWVQSWVANEEVPKLLKSSMNKVEV